MKKKTSHEYKLKEIVWKENYFVEQETHKIKFDIKRKLLIEI